MSYICLNVPFLTLWIPRTNLKIMFAIFYFFKNESTLLLLQNTFSFLRYLRFCIFKHIIWWRHMFNHLSADFTKWSNTLKQLFEGVWPFCGIRALRVNSQEIKNTLPLISHELEELLSCNLANLTTFDWKKFGKTFHSKIWSAH